MPQTSPGAAIGRHHHITLCTGDAQEDYTFHTRLLGFKCVKKTLLYDGQVPIYHLYYGNDRGDESSLVTSFPMGHTGLKARPGSGQIARLLLSAPPGSLPYWQQRLEQHDIATRITECLGERRLDFSHPCGIEYAIVEVADDMRTPRTQGPVPVDSMLRGTHSIAVSVRDPEGMDEFMQLGWGGRPLANDGRHTRYAVGNGASGALVDLVAEPDRKQGSWTLAGGAIHHMAFQIGTHEAQTALKLGLEGLGYTDTSDVKDRGYFDSIYVRTPGGALFEATVSHQPSFTCDEPLERLGTDVIVSPQFRDSRAELVAQLGSLRD